MGQVFNKKTVTGVNCDGISMNRYMNFRNSHYNTRYRQNRMRKIDFGKYLQILKVSVRIDGSRFIDVKTFLTENFKDKNRKS